MSLVIGAFTMGLILALLSLGMFISSRVVRFVDITVDGSFTLGASVVAVVLVNGGSPLLGTCLAVLAGGLAGVCTGTLFTRFKIPEILSGILMMTALYSINLRVMGRSNIPLLDVPTLSDVWNPLLAPFLNDAGRMDIAGWVVAGGDIAQLLTALVFAGVTGLILFVFLRTNLGTALRATGNCSQMARAQGINDQRMVIMGLMLANGLVGLSGALLAQYQGFADVQMGIGMMVWGIASVILGESLSGKVGVGLSIVATVLGTILFRLLIAIALRWGLNPNDLKLVTALFVFVALVLPKFCGRLRMRRKGVSHA